MQASFLEQCFRGGIKESLRFQQIYGCKLAFAQFIKSGCQVAGSRTMGNP
ncbi:MAG: hypothetical protein HC880_05810 [Bacteroidia bacterium]|nr:hypothetical protein [Bacteroidia bacterium]